MRRLGRAALRLLLSPALLLALLLALTACSSAPPRPIDLPPPIQATTMDAGDVFELRIVGEDKLPTEFTVAPDGSVDVPYVKRIKVAGLEPQEIA
ncbi:MAG TPA: polysaccharide biosynthesis/export family protein, partial [Candidatus Nanopelagicales bacterium]|nr:polysaccharide biosynthesis/export family protein [Candidatus Nanopelagicales bacterium]